MRAIVYKSTGSWYKVKTSEGKFFNARIKGIFKMDEITTTNPVAVGDEVEIEEEGIEDNAIINEIYKRSNYIVRSSPHQQAQRHIIASNLDQLLLFATLKEPRTSQGFIDRFLVCAEAFHIPPVIVFNKYDLYKSKELKKLEEFKEIYQPLRYRVVHTSLLNDDGFEQLLHLLAGKATLLSGHSGVGKSTFINRLFPDFVLKTKEVSVWSGKGMHTTTFAEMYDLPGGGRIIDTPGIREFGISDIPRNELSHYFPEMRERLTGCRFNNCLHINEPGCSIKDAMEKGEISEERYVSYYNILNSMNE